MQRFFSILLHNIRKSTQIHKKEISHIFFALILLSGTSFLVEYFAFGHTLHSLDTSEQNIQTIPNTSVVTQDFATTEQGNLVSQTNNATVTLSTQGRFINTLRINFSDTHRDNNPTIQYTDSHTKQSVTLKSQSGKSFAKNKIDPLPFLIFYINDTPETVTLQTSNLNTEITGISIDNTYHFNLYRFFFLFASSILLLFFIFFRHTIGRKPEYTFFVIAFVCGSLIALSETSSYVSWDEWYHYKKSDNASFKFILPKKINDIYNATNSVPYSYSIEEQSAINRFFDTDYKKTAQKNKASSFSLLEVYTNISHIPSGIVLFFGRLLHIPQHLIFSLGRLINVLVFATIIFFAIRMLRGGTMILATIALLPTSLFLASSYNYDSWVTAWIFLAVATIFSELQQPDTIITRKKTLLIFGSFILGLSAKAIYFPLLFLLFLLPQNKFASKKHYRKFIGLSILTILFVVSSFVIPFLVSGEGGDDNRGGKAVDSSKQIHLILTEPLTYTKTLTSFMSGYINPLNFEGLATSFAYLDGIAGFPILLIILILVTLIDKNRYDKYTSTPKIRLLVLAIFFATVALICTALYVAFTPVGKSTIDGVQARYLLPLLFPLLFVIGSHRIKNPFNATVFNTIIFVTITLILLNGIWNSIIRFYY